MAPATGPRTQATEPAATAAPNNTSGRGLRPRLGGKATTAATVIPTVAVPTETSTRRPAREMPAMNEDAARPKTGISTAGGSRIPRIKKRGRPPNVDDNGYKEGQEPGVKRHCGMEEAKELSEAERERQQQQRQLSSPRPPRPKRTTRATTAMTAEKSETTASAALRSADSETHAVVESAAASTSLRATVGEEESFQAQPRVSRGLPQPPTDAGKEKTLKPRGVPSQKIPVSTKARSVTMNKPFTEGAIDNGNGADDDARVTVDDAKDEDDDDRKDDVMLSLAPQHGVQKEAEAGLPQTKRMTRAASTTTATSKTPTAAAAMPGQNEALTKETARASLETRDARLVSSATHIPTTSTAAATFVQARNPIREERKGTSTKSRKPYPATATNFRTRAMAREELRASEETRGSVRNRRSHDNAGADDDEAVRPLTEEQLAELEAPQLSRPGASRSVKHKTESSPAAAGKLVEEAPTETHASEHSSGGSEAEEEEAAAPRAVATLTAAALGCGKTAEATTTPAPTSRLPKRASRGPISKIPALRKRSAKTSVPSSAVVASTHATTDVPPKKRPREVMDDGTEDWGNDAAGDGDDKTSAQLHCGKAETTTNKSKAARPPPSKRTKNAAGAKVLGSSASRASHGVHKRNAPQAANTSRAALAGTGRVAKSALASAADVAAPARRHEPSALPSGFVLKSILKRARTPSVLLSADAARNAPTPVPQKTRLKVTFATDVKDGHNYDTDEDKSDDKQLQMAPPELKADSATAPEVHVDVPRPAEPSMTAGQAQSGVLTSHDSPSASATLAPANSTSVDCRDAAAAAAVGGGTVEEAATTALATPTQNSPPKSPPRAPIRKPRSKRLATPCELASARSTTLTTGSPLEKKRSRETFDEEEAATVEGDGTAATDKDCADEKQALSKAQNGAGTEAHDSMPSRLPQAKRVKINADVGDDTLSPQNEAATALSPPASPDNADANLRATISDQAEAVGATARHALSERLAADAEPELDSAEVECQLVSVDDVPSDAPRQPRKAGRKLTVWRDDDPADTGKAAGAEVLAAGVVTAAACEQTAKSSVPDILGPVDEPTLRETDDVFAELDLPEPEPTEASLTSAEDITTVGTASFVSGFVSEVAESPASPGAEVQLGAPASASELSSAFAADTTTFTTATAAHAVPQNRTMVRTGIAADAVDARTTAMRSFFGSGPVSATFRSSTLTRLLRGDDDWMDDSCPSPASFVPKPLRRVMTFSYGARAYKAFKTASGGRSKAAVGPSIWREKVAHERPDEDGYGADDMEGLEQEIEATFGTDDQEAPGSASAVGCLTGTSGMSAEAGDADDAMAGGDEGNENTAVKAYHEDTVAVGASSADTETLERAVKEAAVDVKPDSSAGDETGDYGGVYSRTTSRQTASPPFPPPPSKCLPPLASVHRDDAAKHQGPAGSIAPTRNTASAQMMTPVTPMTPTGSFYGNTSGAASSMSVPSLSLLRPSPPPGSDEAPPAAVSVPSTPERAARLPETVYDVSRLVPTEYMQRTHSRRRSPRSRSIPRPSPYVRGRRGSSHADLNPSHDVGAEAAAPQSSTFRIQGHHVLTNDVGAYGGYAHDSDAGGVEGETRGRDVYMLGAGDSDDEYDVLFRGRVARGSRFEYVDPGTPPARDVEVNEWRSLAGDHDADAYGESLDGAVDGAQVFEDFLNGRAI